jgi:hypothetical protein
MMQAPQPPGDRGHPPERLLPLHDPRRSPRCGVRSHGLPVDTRPPSAYLATFDPCHAPRCAGTLFCVGHPVCESHGDGLRRGALVWGEPGAEGDDVDVQAITSAGLP